MYLMKAITSVTNMPLRVAEVNHFCKKSPFLLSLVLTACIFHVVFSMVSETRLASFTSIVY